MKETEKGTVSLKDYELFWKEIEKQIQLNKQKLIPKDTYFKDFLEDIPVALVGTVECFKNGHFVRDVEKSFEDKNYFAFTEYHVNANISGDSKQAPYHPIVDKCS